MRLPRPEDPNWAIADRATDARRRLADRAADAKWQAADRATYAEWRRRVLVFYAALALITLAALGGHHLATTGRAGTDVAANAAGVPSGAPAQNMFVSKNQ